MIYGYIRVSSDKQTVENQRFEIEKFCKVNTLHIDGWIEVYPCRVRRRCPGAQASPPAKCPRLLKKQDCLFLKKVDFLVSTYFRIRQN